MIKILRGKVHGKTIELAEDLDVVEVQVFCLKRALSCP
jgi:hypothetical protein